MSNKKQNEQVIKDVLKLKGITQNTVAKRIGVGKTAVSLVIKSKRRSKRIESRLASILGIKASRLWHPTKRTNVKFTNGRRG